MKLSLTRSFIILAFLSNSLCFAASSTQEKIQPLSAEVSQQLFSDPVSPILGVKSSDVTLIKFINFNAEKSKAINQFQYSAARIIYKFIPDSDTSNTAALASLASQEQNKFIVYNDALFHDMPSLTQPNIFLHARKVGLHINKLQTAMQKTIYKQELTTNEKLLMQLTGSTSPGILVITHGSANNSAQLYTYFFVPNKDKTNIHLKTIISKMQAL